MNREEISREELFALVWERPTTEIARELGISDVALGKLCHRLQVPKPPRGYWARVQAGRTPQRPPLPAFREEIDRQRRERWRNARAARLTPIQRQFFDRAPEELRKQGVDTGECELAYDGICALGPELAAQILLVIQNRYQKWMNDETVQVRATPGARRSLAGLVDKLLPLAKEQVLVLRERDRHRYTEDRAPIVIVRLTEWLQKRLAGLAHLVREQKLAYIAAPLLPPEHAWAIHHLFAADSYANAESTLCISANELWVECTRKSFWHDGLTETSWTEKLPLHAVIPVDFLSSKGIDLPAVLPRTAVWDGSPPVADRQKCGKRLSRQRREERVPNEALCTAPKRSGYASAG